MSDEPHTDDTQQTDEEPRTDREDGGPVAEPDAPDVTGEPGAHGDKETPGFEPHE